jgi:hypothetical protein
MAKISGLSMINSMVLILRDVATGDAVVDRNCRKREILRFPIGDRMGTNGSVRPS